MLQFTIQCSHCGKPVSVLCKPHETFLPGLVQALSNNNTVIPKEYVGDEMCECGYLTSIMVSTICVNPEDGV